MNLRHLEIVQAVMRTGSVSQAAELLGLSQPAVSVILKHAESQLRMKLFQRVRGRLRPTPEAKLLAPDMEGIFHEIERFHRRAGELRDGSAGSLSVAAPPQLATAFLTNAVSTFCSDRQEVRVIIRSAPTSEVIDIVLREQVDLGIVYAPYGGKAMVVRQIGTTEIACAIHPDHELAQRAFITPVHLSQYPIISYRADTPLRISIEKAFRKANVPLVPHIETSTLSACVLAKSGAGVALIDPLIMIGDLFPDLVIRPFRPASRLGVQLISPPYRPMSRVTQQFAAHLESTLSSSAAKAPI